jgi:hypothetical protein
MEILYNIVQEYACGLNGGTIEERASRKARLEWVKAESVLLFCKSSIASVTNSLIDSLV